MANSTPIFVCIRLGVVLSSAGLGSLLILEEPFGLGFIEKKHWEPETLENCFFFGYILFVK